MTHVKRIVSSALLMIGVTFVFAGMSAALGFTLIAMLASVAAIVTLLYAGGTWLGARPVQRDCVLVFDRALRVTSGAASGTHVSMHFPAPLRQQIEARCAAALCGQPAHFTCEVDGVLLGFQAAPLQAADGTILYGILLAGAATPPPAALT